jgi:hypothetical protein
MFALDLMQARLRRWIVPTVAAALLAGVLPFGGAAMAATATQLKITSAVPSTANSGIAVAFTVAATDSSGTLDSSFVGSVTTTSTDPHAMLPGPYTYTTGTGTGSGYDNGQHTFSVTFATPGVWTVSFSSPGLTGITSTGIDVTQSKLVVTLQSATTTTAGSAVSITVQAQDSTGVPLTNFTGTVSLTSTDPHAVLPGSYAYTNADSGTHAFSVTLVTAGTQYVSFASPGLSSAQSSGIAVTPGTATKLIFVQQPAATTPTLLAPQPTVGIADAYGNLVSGASASVTLSLNPNPTSAVLTCSNGSGTNRLTLATTSGLASYAGCTVNLTGSGYQLTASAHGYTSAQSNSFGVTSGPASRLAFCWGSLSSGCSTTAPIGSTGGTAFPVQPTIVLQDANGNTVTSDSSTVVTLAIATGGTGATLTCTGTTSGVTSLRVSSGIASFTGCSINKVGTYQLTATSYPYDTPATSNAFAVSAGPPARLTFTAQPTAGYAGQPLPIQPMVAITDAGGNVATTSGATITLALSAGTPGASLSCTGGLSRATYAGVATFSGCSINIQGTNYVISALATNVVPNVSLASAVTSPFSVSAPAAQIAVTPSTRVIVWAKTVVLTTHFGVNGAGKTFALQASTDQANWYQIAMLTTNSVGDASFPYTPATNLWYRAVFAGTPDLAAATSTPVRVVVRQIALLRPTNGGRVVTIARGTTMTWRVTVRPNRPELPHAKVGWEFYIYRGGRWAYLTTRYAFTDNLGIATLSYRFESAGQWYVRAQAYPLPLNANSGWSPVNRYSVQ